ncbi:MAG TPA: sulfurtransferase [Thermoanaerobaculia bacterium]|jgi:thiosulfate/3-mercaptopyruvate sulfurtransferase
MDLVILDARTADAYAAGHLPGAMHADLETQLSSARDEGADPARGGRHPLPPLDRWLQQVARWGITPTTRVVVYDDQRGANAAARVWWMLRAIGHENVEVLDTDWREWSAADRSASKRNVGERSAAGWALPTVSMSEVDQLRSDPAWRVLDVRATPRYRGDIEPIDPVAGHIPGAINLPYTENLDKSPAELKAMYEQLLGDVPPERLVVHCGSGVTACHTLLALDRAGLHGASLYVGSWGEWCRNDMPIGKVSE